ncbi:MAG: acetate--CoA ligase family protein [Candidatus Krumholzibacteriales bacterium]
MLKKPAVRKIEQMLRKALREGRSSLFEHEVYDILDLAGMETPAHFFISGPEEAKAEITGKAVCKLISPGMVHRTEFGGIKFIEATDENIKSAFSEFSGIAGEAGVEFSGMLVAEYLEIEESIPRQLILSLRQDRSFGPVVVMGPGGTGTEIYRENFREDRGLLLTTPETVRDRERIEKLLNNNVLFPIIAGKTRISKEPLIEPDRLMDILAIFAELAEVFSRSSTLSEFTIEELEVNPLQIRDGKAVALDGLLKFSRSKHRPGRRNQDNIKRLLAPEKVLMIGASASRKNMGRQILKNLSRSGDRIKKDNILALHPDPGVNEIEGVRSISSLGEIEGKVDLAVITVPASDILVEMIEKIIRQELASSLILISAGFDETEKGAGYSERLKKTLKEQQESSDSCPVINGPNCMGIVSGPGGYNTFFLPDYKISYTGKYGKNSAFISQSGAFVVTMKNILTRIDPAYQITVGNQIDLTVTDHLDTIGKDENIDTFFLYLEGFKRLGGRRFLETARRLIGSGKKIVAYKAGRTSEGAAAVASHTAAMAGDYFMFKKLLKQEGILLAETLDEFEDCMKIFSMLTGEVPAGNRVGIISDAGYECSSASDTLGDLDLASFSEDTMAGLTEDLPDIVNARNPVDSTPAIGTAAYGRCVKKIINDPNTDCIIISNVASTATQENLPPGEGHDENIYNENSHPNTLIRLVKSTGKPAVISMNGGGIYDPAVELMEEAGLCVFRKIDRAVRAMDRFVRYSISS